MNNPIPLPPTALTVPHPTHIHGETLEDNYFWLRDKSSPQVAEYLRAENTYTDAWMASTDALQKTIYSEILSHIVETDEEPPYQNGGFLYRSQTVQGKQYPIFSRKPINSDEDFKVVFDLNQMAEGHSFFSIGMMEFSECGRFAAFSTDTTGFREYTLYIKDLESESLFPEKIEKTGSAAWSQDSRTLFYTVEDSAKRDYRLYRHVVGSDPSEDVLIYEETDEMFRVGVYKTRSGDWIVLDSDSHTTSESRVLRASEPLGDFKLITPRQSEKIYQTEHHTGSDQFYIRTNDLGKNYRVVTAPVSNPSPENWKEVVPHSNEIMREALYCFEKFFVLHERENGLPHIRVVNIETGTDYRAEFPEPAYTVQPVRNYVFHAETLRYSYQSMVTPPSVFDLNMETGESILVKQNEVPGGFDRANYTSDRIFATASDGTQIPISVVSRRDTPQDGTAPLYLYAYGSYGMSMPAHFSVSVLSLLNRGFVFAIAHIRGGGELGKAWHDAGKMQFKMNTFTDFIASAETLISLKYAAPDKVIAEGGSAGGLLMGAITNLRPELFRAVISKVPFVDVINTMLDETLPLTIGEFEEWGNPKVPEQYAWIRAYCPYTNLKAGAYPAILVKTSFNDSQVMYWEPAKYIAKLRTLKTNETPLLLKTNMDGGHGGSSGRYDRIKETAFDYAFMLKTLGLD